MYQTYFPVTHHRVGRLVAGLAACLAVCVRDRGSLAAASLDHDGHGTGWRSTGCMTAMLAKP